MARASWDGPALTARFGNIGGIVAAGGTLYISDQAKHRIRKLHDGIVSTLAGTGEGGFRDGDSDVVQFHFCFGIALDSQGRLLVAYFENHRIRIVTMDGATASLRHRNHEDWPVVLRNPRCVVAAPDGSIYAADWSSIRKISTDGIVTTTAGSA
jgi:sugar lactone lactonase YvrE